MAISDETWREWLQAEQAAPVVLVEVSYWDAAIRTAYFSDRGYIDPFDAGAPNYLPVIESDVIIDDDLGSSTISAIDIALYDPVLLNYQWSGHNVRILYGDRTWSRADFRTLARNRTSRFICPSPDKGRFEFGDLSQYYFDQLITGTERSLDIGLPFVFGSVFNAQPRRLGSRHFVYYTPDVQAITYEVRDRGVPLAHSSITHTVVPGAPGEGTQITLELPATPSGEITADYGDWTEHYTETESVLSKIIHQLNGFVERPMPLSASVSEFDTAELGYFCSSHVSVETMLRQMCDSIGINPRISATGQLEMVRIDDSGEPTREASDANLVSAPALIGRESPYLALNLTYRKNWTVQTSNLAASLTEAQFKLYGDDSSVASATRTLSGYPMAKPQKVDTLLYSQGAAQTELARRFGLRDRDRTQWRIQGDATWVADEIADTIRLKTPDFGLTDGANFVVIGNRKNLTRGRCEVVLWK